MIIHLTNETAVKVYNFLHKNTWWVSYLDHEFQIESIERLMDFHPTGMAADYKFVLGPCISCREQRKNCMAADYFFSSIESLGKSEA
ncbi:hypothetical protein C6378_01680 [Acinetobacter pittii]|uniref:hypothetical protein n=1 Tax=Acinetobacter pittii TaxID=48296 RepID=UPI0013741D85|nr:hypothetical protein [Acinetobacter pittii]MBQ5174111.1 hypothetical protein [Acinetobacter pittii]QHQ32096.1 hypothetical protein EPY81_12120 [Acinetobacter pittii]USQ61766.1 hypothetical protein C7A15_13425 [Acinetobacter pittii]UTD34391.1 hypothetical protein DDE02_11530 [Acinetobacter pittii]